VDEAVEQARVWDAIREAAGPLLVNTRLFDVYRGAPVPAGRKSLAYALTYQAADRTLSDEEVSAAHGQVENTLKDRFGAEIRGRRETASP
jgi:phenylalanyl-tRNA synthetase beta chain